jgi:uncharacterized protein (UPF0262 family)
MTNGTDQRLTHIELDEASLASLSPEQDEERKIAIQDLLDNNCFQPEEGGLGPYSLKLSTADNRLVLEIAGPGYERRLLLSMSPLRGVIKDYFMLCDSYYAAIRNATTPARIEALDMGRRGVHNEAAAILRERLKGKVEVDNETARRLFTMVCALRWRG